MDDLQLTKKAEAYVAANYSEREELPPPLLVDCQSRRSIADSIERLIDMLDAMSPDPDLEDGADDEPSLGWGLRGGQSFLAGTAPNLPPGDTCDLELDNSDDEDAGDSEPTMGAVERHPTSRESPWGRCGELTVLRYGSNSQEDWPGSRATLPSQDECEAENEHGGDVLDEPHDREEGEPELGWTEHIDQRLAGKVEEGTSNHPEGEPDMGWPGIATGWRATDGTSDHEANGDELDCNGDEGDYDGGEPDQPGFISGGQGL